MAQPPKPKANLGQFLSPYRGLILVLGVLALAANGLSLLIPRRIGQVIDAIQGNPGYAIQGEVTQLVLIIVAVVILTMLQIGVTAYTSLKTGFDVRKKLAEKLSRQSYAYVGNKGASDLLTIFTSDVDAVRNIVAQGIVSLLTAVVILAGSIYFLFITNVKLSLIALSTLAVIAITFFVIFRKIGHFFGEAQKNLSRINKVINESIIGAMLIRVLNSHAAEEKKFTVVNERSREIGRSIIDMFSALIPIITLVSNGAIALILWFGGHLILENQFGLGELSAFISYFNLLITPIFILGFISSILSRSVVSLGRINGILEGEDTLVNKTDGENKTIQGKIEFRNVTLRYGQKTVLKDVSFTIQPHSRTAIIGPTASGKSQLMSLMAGLIQPTEGQILIDDVPLETYDRGHLLSQVGLVFQDSIIFRATLKENILFRQGTSEETLDKAVQTAALEDLVNALPEGLATQLSERGSNLSGGQKQRLMLARALSLQPRILLLDDFTARVDRKTEQTILSNLRKNYQDLTLVSITQKIEPVKDYDQVLLMMEGELLDAGSHDELMHRSFEYQQIAESQATTE